MVAVAVLLLWAVGIPLLSGGDLVEPRPYLVAPFSDPRPLDPASLPTVLWSIPWWLWLVPFGGATVMYLLTSAVLLATPHPGRWIVGTVLGLILLARLADSVNLIWMLDPVGGGLESLVDGRYGLSALLTGGTSAVASVDLPTGESLPQFVGLPTFGRWLVSTLVWVGLGLAVLGLASLRHRDGATGFGRGE
jgi:hypothetical protein